MATWLEIARENRKAATTLSFDQISPRSVISRAYYAVFAYVTHELLLVNVEIPASREAPSHQRLQSLVINRLSQFRLPKRRSLAILVGSLYDLRIAADYMPSVEIDAREARHAVSIMNKVFEVF